MKTTMTTEINKYFDQKLTTCAHTNQKTRSANFKPGYPETKDKTRREYLILEIVGFVHLTYGH